MTCPVERDVAAPAAGLHGRLLHRGLHLAVGGLILLLAGLGPGGESAAPCWQLMEWPLRETAAIVALLGWVTYRPGMARISAQVCLALGALLVAALAGEAAGHLLGLDFHHLDRTRRRIAPFYWQPEVPVGEVFFRRSGPRQWTGRPISAYLEALGVREHPYTNEAPVTATYDAEGFRNLPAVTEWEVAVAGDSFTELGCLPDDALFTTRLADRLRVRVRNLGVSHTGPLSHLCYLREFGRSPATREVVIVFYEGNDLMDLIEEDSSLRRWRETGLRPIRPDLAQPSLFGRLCEHLTGTPEHFRLTPRPPDAWFRTPEGEIPVSLSDLPLPATEISPEPGQPLGDFLQAFAGFGRQHQVRTGLAWMPCKARVIEGQYRLTEHAPASLREWRPDALPEIAGRACVQRGIRFLDLTPALRAVCREEGRLPFHGLYETHLNARGSQAVADALARWLSPLDTRSQAAGSPPTPE